MRIAFQTYSRERLALRVLARISRTAPGLLVLAALFCDPSLSELSAATSLEYEVKAAFLFNFTKFVDWPPNTFAAPDSPFTICILGDDPFNGTLDQLVQGETVNGHRIAIERMQDDQQKSCQLMYVGGSKTVPAGIGVAGSPVLTVGEDTGFVHQGGMIGFVVDSGRVRFDINLKAATSAGLKLSSKLLSVARYVRQ